MSLRSRFFTPQVFAALFSPLSIGLLVGVSVVGALVGLPIVAAIAIGIVVYAVKVASAIPRRQRARRIDPFVLSEPWRRHVQAALSAKGRFDRTVRATRGGPIKDRLLELSSRLDGAVEESWRIATKGHDIDAALSRLDTARAEAELQRLRRLPSSDADQSAAIASLEATVASGHRMQQTSTSTLGQLELLDTRLGELVARAAEVSVGVGDTAVLGHDVDDLVTSLEGLRLALDETKPR